MPADFAAHLLNILGGAWISLQVALLSLALALAIGFPVASMRLSQRGWLYYPATVYTTLFRGIPDLVLMFFLFYGGQQLANDLTDAYHLPQWDINPFIAGCITLGMIFGAYMAETFRAAILAVPYGQTEAALAFGMSRRQCFRRIVFPQMLRHAMAGIGNNWLVLLKTTALVSIIGLSDMVRRADLSGKATHAPLFFYLLVAVIFLLFTSVSILVLRVIKKRFNRGFENRLTA
ncbi:MAG: ABC transporter permease subunit [Proteobacteria bacterium]|nr:ABC transporter permease subunit [Pseudomonadota bacterium]MCL2310479.1 ABC transporter permease subunit [Pseudomonadota bacterium]